MAGIPCIRLQDAPPEEAYLQGVYLHFQSGVLAGVKLPVDKVMGSVVVPLLSPTLDLTSALQSVKPGDQVALATSCSFTASSVEVALGAIDSVEGMMMV